MAGDVAGFYVWLVYPLFLFCLVSLFPLSSYVSGLPTRRNQEKKNVYFDVSLPLVSKWENVIVILTRTDVKVKICKAQV